MVSIKDIDSYVVNKVVAKVPNEMTLGKNGKETLCEKISHYTTPENRLVMGATALAFQPMIDLHNKDVDEKTRKTSCARTVAKIIAGTFTGYYIRKGCIKLIDGCTITNSAEIEKLKGFRKKIATSLVPNVDVVEKTDKLTGKLTETKVELTAKSYESAIRLAKKHKEAVGTFLALGVMVFTNFLIDVPLTKFLTNTFVSKFVDKKSNDSVQKGGQ